MKNKSPAPSRKKADGTLSDAHIKEYVEFACRVAEMAGREILPHFRSLLGVENKATAGRYDPVTLADKAAERVIREEIERAYPDHSIVGEEQGRKAGTSPMTWVIDPIDGTLGFVLGLPQWGTLIALNDGTRPIVGLMHQPFVGETFVGSRLGAELRRAGKKRRLRTRECANIEEASLCATHPRMFSKGRERDAFDELAARCKQTRYGGDCYPYCLIAAGLVDLVVEAHNKRWDVEAHVPIIEAAGGVITDWSGAPNYDGAQVVAAGDPELHRLALEILSRGATGRPA